MARTYVYPKLAAAKKRAASFGLDPSKLTSSKTTPYKLDYDHNGRTIRFGHRDYEDYLIHQDKNRRTNYRTRHRGVLNGDGKPAYKIKYTPAWMSYYILW